MTNSNQQALTLQAVQEAAETLMLLHDQTTTLDVKNYLRRNHFLAFQKDVSQFMNSLVQQQNTWKANDHGRYRIYSFAQDSQEYYHEYLEKGADFWEIEVDKVQQIITLGKIGTAGGSYQTTLKSNRHAIKQAKFLLKQKMNGAYVKAIDQRLPKSLRTRYEKWLKQKVEQCTLAFYGVEKIEKQAVNLFLNQNIVPAYLLTSKSAGYEISFKKEQALQHCANMLHRSSWDVAQTKDVSLYLTGEKTTHKAAFISDNSPVTDYSVQQLLGKAELQQLLVHQHNLYQVRLVFDHQKTLTLSKFELDLEKELLPLVWAFLG